MNAKGTPSPDFSAGIDLGLRGSIAVVIGGGPGIGLATAQALAAAGCHVVVADLDLGVAAATADQIGPSANPLEVDVTDRLSVARLFDAVVRDVGMPSTVVNVVGISRAKSVEETTDADWDEMQALNLRHQFVVAQEAARVLARPGSYVAIASINGVVSSPKNAAYGAAKAGLVSLVRSLALELAPEGVRVNAVAPGIVETPRLHEFFVSSGRLDEFASAVPMGRVAQPSDIAGAVCLLASPLAAYVTGQVLAADGGASVKYPLALLG